MSGSGNQIQLIAKGSIDSAITGNPSITFFKSVYRKHTNFSMEDLVIATISTPLTGAKYPVKIPVGIGDLLADTNYIIRGNKVYCGNGIANISTAVIDNISFVINSREIDKTFGHYLEVYHELNQVNPNSTITNLGRIEDSSLYHLAHNANLAAMATHKSMINNNRSDTSYFDNSVSKPTNIMGSGACSYPPTHFQKLSKCAGTYCAPTYLQEQNSLQPNGSDVYSSNYNYVSSLNTIPTSSGHVSGMNRSRFNASLSTYTQDTASATFTYDIKGLNQFIVGASYTAEKIGPSIFNISSVNGNSVHIKGEDFIEDNSLSGSLVEFKLVDPQIYSANLLNASQISDSKYKGDILGDCTVPLNFWYCKSPGMSIPLCALNKSVDVELYMQFATSDAADWSNNIDSISNKNLTYDHNINNYNDIVNSYKLGGTNVIPICNNNNTKFQFDVDISVTYIYLDNMERKRFSQSSHEYLIEQLQVHYENGQTNSEIDISSFQNPVKELIWCGQPYLKNNIRNITSLDTGDDGPTLDKINGLNTGKFAHKSGIRWVYGNSTDNCIYGGGIQNSSYSKGFGNASFIGTIDSNGIPEDKVNNLDGDKNDWSDIGEGKFVQGLLGPSTPDCLDYVTYKLKFNSTDRCSARPLSYFTRENIYKYHKGSCVSVPDSIAVYSFALNPTDTSPSGKCNFSNIDDIKIERGTSTSKDTNIKYKKVIVYAINYNILRFVNGQGGLSYI